MLVLLPASARQYPLASAVISARVTVSSELQYVATCRSSLDLQYVAPAGHRGARILLFLAERMRSYGRN